MKKVLSMVVFLVLLLLLLITTLTGCGSSKDNEPSSNIEVESSDNDYLINEQSAQGVENEVYDSGIYYTTIANVPICTECGNECEVGHSYCSLHECCDLNCILPRDFMSSYCTNHHCLLCGRMRSLVGSVYCDNHKCSKCENVVVEGSDYCAGHKCMLCEKQAVLNGYCNQHS